MDKKFIRGSGGGGGGGGSSTTYVPVEAENSLQANTYAKLVDLICEGEIGGPANGDSWYKSTYYNEIPIQNSDGSFNYSGVTLEGRVGTTTQTYLNGFNGVENEIDVSTPVTVAGGAISRTVTDSNVDTVKVTIAIPTLLSQADNGDLNKTTVQLQVSVIPDNGAGTPTIVVASDGLGTIYGKCLTEYRKQYVIENISQYGSSPWVIRVTRITADSGSAKLINAFSWYTYTTVIDTKLRYYQRAVVGATINGSEFGNQIPSRAYKINGRKISIPDNYNPVTRTYSGDWSGTFTTGVTNNPAWVIYDLLTDPDIGLGQIISESMVDKWSLYACAAYCDATITVTNRVKQSNGTYSDTTSSEHRFSFNGVIESRSQALEIITHLCSVMRAYPIWVAGQVTFVQDKPITSPARPAGLSNVSSEGFEYEGIPKRNRHTVVKVSWNDPALLGKLDTIELVDEEGIINFGYNDIDFAAFGCTSRTEAIRRGKYVLDTDINAREVVKFKGGLDWADALPGELISVQDPNYAAVTLEGRVMDSTSTTTTSLKLDKTITISSGVTYTMLIQNATGAADERVLTNSAGDTNILTWSSALSIKPFTGAQLVISASNLATRKFVITNIVENSGFYDVMGVEYDPDKYARIETGIVGELPVNNGLLPSILEPPTNIVLEPYTYTTGDQELRLFGIQISWVHSIDPRKSHYEIRYRPTTGGWQYLATTTENNYDWKPVVGDVYDIGVRAVGVGITSDWVTYTDFELDTALTNLAPPTNVDTKEGGGLFSGRDCTIIWTPSVGSQYASTYDDDVGDSNVDHYKVEVRKADTTLLRSFDTAKDATEYTYFYTYNLEDNETPLRNLLFYVYSVDVFGISSTTYDSVAAENPIPDMSSTTPVLTPKYGYIKVDWTLTNDNDMSHYKIYLDDTTSPTTLIGIVNHPVNTIDANGLDANTSYYCQIEPYDFFGAGEKSVIPLPASPVTIPAINIDAELDGTITATDSDSNSAATLKSLYDGIFGAGGVSYTLSGTDKYIQYAYNIENYINRVGIWTSSASTRVYFSYSDDATTWSYIKAEADHTTDANGYLFTATNLSDAQTNYLQLAVGFNFAYFPANISAKYVRMWMRGTYTTTIYEFIPSRILVSELAAIGSLSSYSANIGVITAGVLQSTNFDSTSGCKVDLDNGVITGKITFLPGTSGIANISDAGDLASQDTVGVSDCDSTIITGGRITTGLVTADTISSNQIITNSANISNALIDTLHLKNNSVSNDVLYLSTSDQSINSWTYNTYYECFSLSYVTSTTQPEYNMSFKGMIGCDIIMSGNYNYHGYSVGVIYRWIIYNHTTSTAIYTFNDNLGLTSTFGYTGVSAFHYQEDSGGVFLKNINSGWTAGDTLKLICYAARVIPSSPTCTVTGNITLKNGQITGLKK